MSDKIPVVEIFGPTIQGEGSVIGMQTIFIRFGGCDFKCRMCDSLHAVLPDQIKAHARYLTIEEIGSELIAQTTETGVKWITFSGGNPLIWDLTELVIRLQNFGLKITVETQASHWNDWVMLCDSVVLSPKSPGMGERFDAEIFQGFLNNMRYHPNTSVKIVVFSAQDVEFALAVFGIDKHFFRVTENRKFISLGNPMPPNAEGWKEQRPAFSQNELRRHYSNIIEDILIDTRTKDIKILPQMHVLLWDNTQGV